MDLTLKSKTWNYENIIKNRGKLLKDILGKRPQNYIKQKQN